MSRLELSLAHRRISPPNDRDVKEKGEEEACPNQNAGLSPVQGLERRFVDAAGKRTEFCGRSTPLIEDATGWQWQRSESVHGIFAFHLFAFVLSSLIPGQPQVFGEFGEFLFREDAVEARLIGYKEPKNIAHVTSYACIGLASMLRAEHDKEHELPLALQQCGQLLTVGQGRILFQYWIERLHRLVPYMVTGNYQPHPTTLPCLPDPALLPIRAWFPLSRSCFWKRADSVALDPGMDPPKPSAHPPGPPPLISITVHFYGFSDPASNEKGYTTSYNVFVGVYLPSGQNTGSPRSDWTSSGSEAEDNPGTA
ncbi:hypothetical protein F5888DRAFT_1891100 [Russula emetica]|nr:hypothetical protein F5888DRAFT_1891100 [Russula emetica]